MRLSSKILNGICYMIIDFLIIAESPEACSESRGCKKKSVEKESRNMYLHNFC